MVARCCKFLSPRLSLPAAVARHKPTMSGQFPSLVMAGWVHQLANNAASGLLRPLSNYTVVVAADDDKITAHAYSANRRRI